MESKVSFQNLQWSWDLMSQQIGHNWKSEQTGTHIIINYSEYSTERQKGAKGGREARRHGM